LFVAHWLFEEKEHKFFYCNKLWKNIFPKARCTVKAEVKVAFDRSKFHIRLDYEKDNIHHLDSRVIINDGTAIMVNKISKYIIPSHSEANVYEAKPIPSIMRKTGFDYNPCKLPADILPADLLSSPKFASDLTIKPDANMDYSVTFICGFAPQIHESFIASHNTGYHITNYRQFNTKQNNFQHINRQATWERKNNIWYVKSIDTQLFQLDGSSERTVFQYTTFEPNVKVSPSMFTFNALSLSPTARVIDRRPNAEEPVLHQSKSTKVDAAKLDKLADTLKALTPASKPHTPSSSPLRSNKWRRYYLFGVGAFFCVLGLLLMWRRIRTRKGNVTPNP
jgi:hypothetical protein